MPADKILAMLPIGVYPSIVLHMILASLKAIPINLLMILLATILVICFPRAINKAAKNQCLKSVFQMTSVLDRLLARVADIKKDQDTQAKAPMSTATTGQPSPIPRGGSAGPSLPFFAKQNSVTLKLSQNDTKTATKQDATPVSDAQPSPLPSTAQGGLTSSHFASDTPKTTPGKEAPKVLKQAQTVAKVETPPKPAEAPQKSGLKAEGQKTLATPATKVGMGKSRFASSNLVSTICTKPADTKQQPQSVVKKEAPQNMVPKLDAAPKSNAKPKTDAQSPPITSATKVGLGFSRYSSAPLPTPGEQTTKVSQQLQTPKKEQTPQVVLPNSNVAEAKPKATQPTTSLPILSLGNAITPSTSTEQASSAVGPVNDNTQQVCKICNKSVPQDMFKQHCDDEVSGIWDEFDKFHYDAHKGMCFPKPKPTSSPSRPQDIGMPTIRRKDPKSGQHKSLRGSGHQAQLKQQNFRNIKSGHVALEGKVIVYS